MRHGPRSFTSLVADHGIQAQHGQFRTGVWHVPDGLSDQEQAWYAASREYWNVLQAALQLVWLNSPIVAPSIRDDMSRLLRFVADVLDQDRERCWSAEAAAHVNWEVQYVLTDGGSVSHTFTWGPSRAASHGGPEGGADAPQKETEHAPSDSCQC